MIRSKTSLKFGLRVAFKYITGPSNTCQGLQIHDRAFKYMTGPSNTSQSLQILHRAFKYNAGPSRFRIYIAAIHSIPLAPFDRFQILVVWFRKIFMIIFFNMFPEENFLRASFSNVLAFVDLFSCIWQPVVNQKWIVRVGFKINVVTAKHRPINS